EDRFFKIGYYFNILEEKGYFEDLGYADIYDLAEKEFGFKSTTVKNLMLVNRTYCCCKMDVLTGKTKNFTDVIAPQYEHFSQTQLVEMLPLSTVARKNIPSNMTVAEIRDYKKAIKSNKYGRYEDNVNNPYDAVYKYREVNEKEKKLNASGACPGQLLIPGVEKSQSTDRTEGITIPTFEPCVFDEAKVYYSSKNPDPSLLKAGLRAGPCFNEKDFEEYESQSTDQPEEAVEKVNKIIQPLFPARHIFKNDKERLDFINDERNFDRLVLKNEELGIEIRSLKFHNGAILYQTIHSEYYEWSKQTKTIRTLHLVNVNCDDKKPDSNACYGYGLKTYTLKGTAPTYVVKYMSMYKNEI
ncbi:MAG: hypothetical protein IJY57_01160, partial [Clostridia bacterium]|nr:hypothetical protein [Clostridia bacterium]